MEDIIDLLKTDPRKAIEKLTKNKKNSFYLENLRREYYEIARDIRISQVDKIQEDKWLKGRLIRAVRIPIPFQNKIVRTSTAFEVGEPPSIIPNIYNSKKKENELTNEIKRLFKVNRINSTIQKAISKKKSELQCAVLFNIENIDPSGLFNGLFRLNTQKEIKTTLLTNEKGDMCPVFDDFGDMIYFVWSFTTKTKESTVRNIWVYDKTNVYKLNDIGNEFAIKETIKHGFGKIPIAYTSQPYPEWHDAERMIDRLEVSLSKLGASNDYSGHPILKLYGEVNGLPDKNDDGKALRFNVHEDKNTGKVSHGDAKFLTHDNAPEAVKLEIDRLEKYIYSLTSTPDLSLENLKGIGDISGKAIRLMFLDAIIKSKMNEGENRTFIERIINIFVSGIVTTTATKLKKEARNTFFDVKFNSILPSDINEDIQAYVQAVKGKVLSHTEAIKAIDMADDAQRELSLIKEETEEFNKLEEQSVSTNETNNVAQTNVEN